MSEKIILTVDAGNTHTRMAFWDKAGSLLAQENFLSAAIRDRNQEAREKWWHRIDTLRPAFAAVSCVVPALRDVLSAWTSETALSLTFVTHRDVGLSLDILHPQLAGIDRLVNCAAAWRKFADSCLVIDMGTAVTWDVVLAPGIFAGGVIAPGLEILAEALSRRTSLPAVQPRPCDDVIGRDTESCLRCGAWFGYLAQAEGIAGRIRQRFPQIRHVILTGGAAAFVRNQLPDAWIHLPMLTHEGLLQIALEKNSDS